MVSNIDSKISITMCGHLKHAVLFARQVPSRPNNIHLLDRNTQIEEFGERVFLYLFLLGICDVSYILLKIDSLGLCFLTYRTLLVLCLINRIPLLNALRYSSMREGMSCRVEFIASPLSLVHFFDDLRELP